MSSAARVVVLPALARHSAPRKGAADEAARPVVRIAAFAALGLYGALRWATLLTPAPTWRLLGVLGISILLAACGSSLRDRSAPVAALIVLVAVLAALGLAGLPLQWIFELRIAVARGWIGQGLSGIPQALVPYNGPSESVRTVIVLGGAALLTCSAVLLAFAPHSIGDARRACAAVPLLVLAVVPSTLIHPALPYLNGVLIFGLLVAFVWGERLLPGDYAAAVALCVIAAAGGMLAAPGLERHKPWIDYQALAGSLVPARVESFDWSQRYGPIDWPRTGKTVLEVRAAHPDYWKAEDLDVFNGFGWVQGSPAGVQSSLPPPDIQQQWTQTLVVTIAGMTTNNVIAAGYAAAPKYLTEGAIAGVNPGTWITLVPLQPGDSYTVRIYSPHPTPAQLAAAGDDYPGAALAPYRMLSLPPGVLSIDAPTVLFPAFKSGQQPQNVIGPYGVSGADMIQASPYAEAYALASRLARRSSTPYQFVSSVEQYLARGFSYNEHPPARIYPLESFLFRDRIGYCQQFAGAMALLLRMGGIPARVAAGFTTGTYDTATHSWTVTDFDAHAWVEAWFPHYGWVTFDPTPAAAPARSGREPVSATRAAIAFSSGAPAPARRARAVAPAAPNDARSRRGSPDIVLIVAAAALLVLVALATIAARRPAATTPEQALAELERAFARSRRPIEGGVTLAALERRLGGSPQAAGYVRAIRLARFGSGGRLPTAEQRRALRVELRAGRGLLARLRALWALPPRSRRGVRFRRLKSG